MKKNILITGLPKSGKSTILKKVTGKINSRRGFITNEIIKGGERIGFELETWDGKKILFASPDLQTAFKVSRYFVDVKRLDELMPSLNKFDNRDLLFLDEIGQMQLFSEKFKLLVEKYLNSKNIFIGTLSKIYSDSFIESIKERDDVILIEINENNRNEKEKYILRYLEEI